MRRSARTPGGLLISSHVLQLRPLPTADTSATCFSPRYQQTYHSIHGARSESRLVYLFGAGVADRLDAGLETRVLEIGFGLALNFLLTADYAATRAARLYYHAVENQPVSASTIAALRHTDWLRHPELATSMLSLLESTGSAESAESAESANDQPATSGLWQLSNNCTLYYHVTDALQLVQPAVPYDAIYLDAFSPDVNPECWTLEFFKRLHPMLHADGALATYCVKGSVQRALQAAGFETEKRPGPAGKREVLVARHCANTDVPERRGSSQIDHSRR